MPAAFQLCKWYSRLNGINETQALLRLIESAYQNVDIHARYRCNLHEATLIARMRDVGRVKMFAL